VQAEIALEEKLVRVNLDMEMRTIAETRRQTRTEKLKRRTFSRAAQIEARHDSGGVDSSGPGQERDGDFGHTRWTKMENSSSRNKQCAVEANDT
jgi:hypothetical protein